MPFSHYVYLYRYFVHVDIDTLLTKWWAFALWINRPIKMPLSDCRRVKWIEINWMTKGARAQKRQKWDEIKSSFASEKVCMLLSLSSSSFSSSIPINFFLFLLFSVVLLMSWVEDREVSGWVRIGDVYNLINSKRQF